MISLVSDVFKLMWFSIPWLLAIGFLFTSIYEFFWKDQIYIALGMFALFIFSLERIFSNENLMNDGIALVLLPIIFVSSSVGVFKNADFWDREKQALNVKITKQTIERKCTKAHQPDFKKRRLFNNNKYLLNNICANQFIEDGKEFSLNLVKVMYLPPRVGGVDTMINAFDTEDGPLTCIELAQQMNEWCPNYFRLK